MVWLKIAGRFRRIACTAAALVMTFSAAYAYGENTVMVSPEPPAPERDLRPTAAPTAEPDRIVIDHITYPDIYPDFAFSADDKLLDIWFPSIKDADETILMYDGEVWMIDCGDMRAAERGLSLLKYLGITRISKIINTHPHHDHLDGLAMTDEAAKVAELWMCFPAEETESGMRATETSSERGITLRTYGDGDVLTMGDGAVTLEIWMAQGEQLDMNARSAQVMVRFGQRSMLFMADMEYKGQIALMTQIDPDELACDIFKYPHHGKNAMHDEFFEALHAQLAIVTAYKRSDQGQQYLRSKRMPIAFTAKEGMYLHLQTNGKYWLCEYVPASETK